MYIGGKGFFFVFYVHMYIERRLCQTATMHIYTQIHKQEAMPGCENTCIHINKQRRLFQVGRLHTYAYIYTYRGNHARLGGYTYICRYIRRRPFHNDTTHVYANICMYIEWRPWQAARTHIYAYIYIYIPRGICQAATIHTYTYLNR